MNERDPDECPYCSAKARDERTTVHPYRYGWACHACRVAWKTPAGQKLLEREVEQARSWADSQV
jgi:hypothetical protein